MLAPPSVSLPACATVSPHIDSMGAIPPGRVPLISHWVVKVFVHCTFANYLPYWRIHSGKQHRFSPANSANEQNCTQKIFSALTVRVIS